MGRVHDQRAIPVNGDADRAPRARELDLEIEPGDGESRRQRSSEWARHAPPTSFEWLALRQLDDPVGHLGEAVQLEEVMAVDLLAVEVLHDPLAQDVLRIGVLPEPDHGDLAPQMRHQRDRRLPENRRLCR